MEITKESTVADIVSKKLGSDHVFSKYKIDFCCGGGDTLEKACNESGVEFKIIKKEIEAVNTKISDSSNLNDLDIPSLIEKAKDDYHIQISNTIIETLPFAEKVAKVHGAEHNEVVEINELTKGVNVVLTEMLKNSNKSLYPKVSEILEMAKKSEEIPSGVIQGIKKTIKRNEIAQNLLADSFKEISNLSSDYTTPVGACNSYNFLYKNLKKLQHEVHRYMHFEKNILISKALKIIE